MDLKDAIDFWVTESGYRRIQNALSKKAHAGASKYALANAINASNTAADVEVPEAIETLRAAMKPSSKVETYYRGSPSGVTNTHRREGFFAVTRNPGKAAEYGTLYTVVVDADVPRLAFEAEGGEVLLADGMIYEYSPAEKKIHVRTPKTAVNASIPLLGNIYASRKATASTKEAADLKYIISRLYCYSFATPDDATGYALLDDMPECDPEFEKKPVAEQIKALQERLNSLKESGHLATFKEDIHFFFDEKFKVKVGEVIESALNPKSLFGGGYRRKTRRGRKLRRRRTHKH